MKAIKIYLSVIIVLIIGANTAKTQDGNNKCKLSGELMRDHHFLSL